MTVPLEGPSCHSSALWGCPLMGNFLPLPVSYGPLAVSLSSPSEPPEELLEVPMPSAHSRPNKLESLGMATAISMF